MGLRPDFSVLHNIPRGTLLQNCLVPMYFRSFPQFHNAHHNNKASIF